MQTLGTNTTTCCNRIPFLKTQILGPIYTEGHSERFDNSAMMPIVLLSLKTMESLQNGITTHFQVTQLLPSATKLRRLCFYRHLSFHSWGVPDQVHPPGADTPPGTRYTPHARYTPRGADTPPRPGTPQDQVHPPGTRYPPEQTPPWTRYASWDQVPPPPDQVHPPDQVPPGIRYTPPEIRPLLRTVRILLECILVFNENIITSITQSCRNWVVATLTLTFGVKGP